MLSQLIANSIKYTGYETEKCPKLKISSGSENNRVCLSVCDNGCGVKPYELRYLFEKGFTGENSQKKSTGMGLYLVRQIGQELKIEVEAVSVYGKGMEIRLWFPVVQGSSMWNCSVTVACRVIVYSNFLQDIYGNLIVS